MKIAIDEKELVEFKVLKETEKAVEISVYVMIGCGGFRTGMWLPKSMTGAAWFFQKKCKELQADLFDRYGKPAKVTIMVKDGVETAGEENDAE
jgi:hypothetical protein